MKFLILQHVRLIKLPIVLMSGLFVLTGFVLYKETLSLDALFAAFSFLLITSGAMILNNYQDRHLDSRMERTRHRPLVVQSLPLFYALLLASLFLIAGIYCTLYFGFGLKALIPAFVGLVLYNFIYTPLKKKSFWAILPGILCGMVPPLFGWIAAGGPVISPLAMLLAVLLGTWQVPHLWLIFINHKNDYKREMIPEVFRKSTMDFMKYIIFLWITVLGIIILMFPLFISSLPGHMSLLFAFISISLVLIFGWAAVHTLERRHFRILFLVYNIFTLILITGLIGNYSADHFKVLISMIL